MREGKALRGSRDFGPKLAGQRKFGVKISRLTGLGTPLPPHIFICDRSHIIYQHAYIELDISGLDPGLDIKKMYEEKVSLISSQYSNSAFGQATHVRFCNEKNVINTKNRTRVVCMIGKNANHLTILKR